MFIPRWRVDDIGTSELTKHWILSSSSFQSRQYGIIFIKGSFSQSWQNLAEAACDFESASYIAKWVSATYNSFNGVNDGCENEGCTGNLFNHMSERCKVYRNLRTVSQATMGLTFISVLAVTIGALIALMASTKRMGGIVFFLFFLSGCFSLMMNAWWALASDAGFKELGRSAYYPYPSLGLSWFLHLYGCATIIVGASVYGWVIYPVVSTFDPVENKMNKRIEKLEKRQFRREDMKAKKAEQQQQQQAQAQYNQQMYQQQMQMQQMQGYPQVQQYGANMDGGMQGAGITMGAATGANMQVGQVHFNGQQVDFNGHAAGQAQKPLQAHF
jgi:uncharacterized membrane protein